MKRSPNMPVPELRTALFGMRRPALLWVGMIAVVLGLLIATPAGRSLGRLRLPADVEATLVPIVDPPVVNLGHQGNQSIRGEAISEQEGVAIVDSPLESALAEYGRLTQSAVLRPPGLMAGNIDFRGQARPRELAEALSNTLRGHGIRLVELDDDRVAAVGANVRLLRGSRSGNAAAVGALGVGVLLVASGFLLGLQFLRSPSVRATTSSCA